MENKAEVLEQFSKRVQRCYSCMNAFYLKDMCLGEDITYYCENCRGDMIIHFDEHTKTST